MRLNSVSTARWRSRRSRPWSPSACSAWVAIGFLFTRFTLLERVVAFIAALCLLGDFRFSDIAGFALTVAIVFWQWRQRPQAAVAAA